MNIADLKWFNPALARVPMNWAIVFALASLWLMLFHAVMTAWTAMQSGGQAAFAGPGQIAAPIPSTTAAFSAPGSLASGSGLGGLDSFIGGGTTFWTDGAEAKYAEDGWRGNP